MAGLQRALGKTLQGVRTLKERAGSSAAGEAPSAVPYLVEACVGHLEKHHLHLEGLFRVSGSLNDVKALKAQLDKRRHVDLARVANPHTVAGALKLYLRELPRPLMTFELYAAWCAAGAVGSDAKRLPLQLACLREAFRALPPPNQRVLARLCLFLSAVVRHAEQNKMTAPNVAIVFAPTLLRAEHETIASMLADADLLARAVELTVCHAALVCDPAPQPPDALAAAPAPFLEALAAGRARLEASGAYAAAPSPSPSPSASPSVSPSASSSSPALASPVPATPAPSPSAPSTSPFPPSAPSPPAAKPPPVSLPKPAAERPSSARGAATISPRPQEERCAVQIQRLWRGHAVRRRFRRVAGGGGGGSLGLQAAYNVAFGRLRSKHMGLVSCVAELKSYAAIMRSSLAPAPAGAPSEPLATEQDLRAIFGNVDALNETHLALQAQLNRLSHGWPWEVRDVGAAMEQSAARLAVWDDYVAGFEPARRALQMLSHVRPQTRKWLETMQGRSVTGLHLADLLYEPIAQLADLAAHLQALSDALLRHPGRPHSLETYLALRAAALWHRVGRAVRRVDGSADVAALVMTEKTIVGAKDADFIVRPGRRLIRKGEVRIASEKRFMFLFNDLCLVTKQEDLNYAFKYVVELAGSSLRDTPRPGCKHPELTLELETPDRPFQIICRNADDKAAWAAALHAAIARVRGGVFGVPLPQLLAKDGRPPGALPRAAEFLLGLLTPPAPLLPALFCVAGSQEHVRELKDALERGGEDAFTRKLRDLGPGGAYEAASVLRALLDELPEPLLPAAAPLPLLGPGPGTDPLPSAAAFQALAKGLAPPHAALLRALLPLLARVTVPGLDVPAARLVALALAPALHRPVPATVAAALDLSPVELALAALIDQPGLLAGAPAGPPSAPLLLAPPAAWGAGAVAPVGLAALVARKPLPAAPGKATPPARSASPVPPARPLPPLAAVPGRGPTASPARAPPEPPPRTAPAEGARKVQHRRGTATTEAATLTPPVRPPLAADP